jgi:hypothetical protein
VGLRSLELRLLKHLREAIVEEAVHDYLERSRDAGRLLNPVDELKKPILDTGFSPPGLQDAMSLIFRCQPRRRPRLKFDASGNILGVERVEDPLESQEPRRFPDEDELVECILKPPHATYSRKEARLDRIFNKRRN